MCRRGSFSTSLLRPADRRRLQLCSADSIVPAWIATFLGGINPAHASLPCCAIVKCESGLLMLLPKLWDAVGVREVLAASLAQV